MAIINAVEVTFQLTTTAPAGQKAPAGAFDPAEFEYRHTFNGVTTTEKGKTNDQGKGEFKVEAGSDVVLTLPRLVRRGGADYGREYSSYFFQALQAAGKQDLGEFAYAATSPPTTEVSGWLTYRDAD